MPESALALLDFLFSNFVIIYIQYEPFLSYTIRNIYNAIVFHLHIQTAHIYVTGREKLIHRWKIRRLKINLITNLKVLRDSSYPDRYLNKSSSDPASSKGSNKGTYYDTWPARVEAAGLLKDNFHLISYFIKSQNST